MAGSWEGVNRDDTYHPFLPSYHVVCCGWNSGARLPGSNSYPNHSFGVTLGKCPSPVCLSFLNCKDLLHRLIMKTKELVELWTHWKHSGPSHSPRHPHLSLSVRPGVLALLCKGRKWSPKEEATSPRWHIWEQHGSPPTPAPLIASCS